MKMPDRRGPLPTALDRGAWRTALLAALVLTAANAAKPLVIDDPVYVALARQIAAHPGDPYGVEIFWDDVPEPAMSVGTLPPVLPYWLAGAMTLFGEWPLAWKLSLLPFAFALTASLAFLLGRIAKPLATPVLWTLALGPTVLPGMNLMLDVPALALGLAGFALFVHACERERALLALGAGLVLGLALQTKYSALVFAALVLAYAVIYRRPREAALALLAAMGLFVGWELLLVARYGQSHFLAGIERVHLFEQHYAVRLADAKAPGTAALYWTLSLLSLLGGTAPYAALLALVGLGARGYLVSLAAIAVALAFAALPSLPSLPALGAGRFFDELLASRREIVIFVPLGLFTAGCVLAALVRLLRRPDGPEQRVDRLLTVWLLLEIVASCAISPYPAVRRIIGLSFVATLIAARSASQRMDHGGARVAARVATLVGLALASLYFASELGDARARRALVDQVVQRLAQLGASPERETIWYSGHWEVQFYGERAGWRVVEPGKSHLRRGDWLVLVLSVSQPRISYPPPFQRVAEVVASSALPWTTIPPYYSGAVPLQRQAEPHARAHLYRVTGDAVPLPASAPAGAPTDE